jgi:hypothetical protein
MQTKHHFSNAIRFLLVTVAAVLLLNFACARGAGVELMSLLGHVPEEDIAIRSNILKGVDFMQLIIKVTAVIGLIISGVFFVKGILSLKNNRFVKS